MYEPVLRLGPILVNHDVNVRGAPVVVTRIDGGHFDDAIGVGVPATTEPGLRVVIVIGTISTVLASCIGYWENFGHEYTMVGTEGGSPCQISTKVWFIGVQLEVSMTPKSMRSCTPLLRW